MDNVHRNLVVVAHPDDEVLGFGGTGAKLASRGESVQTVMLCGGVDARMLRPSDHELIDDLTAANTLLGFSAPVLGSFPNLGMNTIPHIDIVQFIEKLIVSFRPTRIFTHHPFDLNDDHVRVAKACLAASRLFQRRADIERLHSVHLMEIPSSTDWAFPSGAHSFMPNCFEGIEDQIDSKIRALSCYRGVMRPFPHPRSREVLTGLAAYRGGQSGFRFAEAFQTVFRAEV